MQKKEKPARRPEKYIGFCVVHDIRTIADKLELCLRDRKALTLRYYYLQRKKRALEMAHKRKRNEMNDVPLFTTPLFLKEAQKYSFSSFAIDFFPLHFSSVCLFTSTKSYLFQSSWLFVFRISAGIFFFFFSFFHFLSCNDFLLTGWGHFSLCHMALICSMFVCTLSIRFTSTLPL